jgi:pilus assembly protein CpaE
MKPALAIVKEAPAPASPREPLLAFVGDPDSRALLTELLAEFHLPAALVHDGGIETALSKLSPDSSPEKLIVDLSDSKSPIDDIIALSTAIDPDTIVTALGVVNDVGLFRNLMANGVTDYLVKPLSRDALRGALATRIEREEKPANPTNVGRLIVFIGARGGLGTTTTAANVAWIMANNLGQKVGLVDLDLHFGTIGLALDLESGGGLREALERPGRIDSLFIDRATLKRGDRLFVMSAEEALDENPTLDPEGLDVLLRELRARFEAVVIDMPRHGALLYPAALAQATDVFIMSDLSLAGVRDVIRLETAIKRRCPLARIRIVVCGSYGKDSGSISQSQFENSVGHKVDHVLPHDPKTTAQGFNAGKPLTEVALRSPLAKALIQLARSVVVTAPDQASGPFWRRWKK